MIHSISRLGLVAVAFAVSTAAMAQSYPSRPITLVVPYTPGTGIDIIARTVGPKLIERWGQPVVVENKPGASGNIGANAVAKAQPDGYTMMVTVNTFTITPALYASLPYDPVKDFTVVSGAATGNLALVAHVQLVLQNEFEELTVAEPARRRFLQAHVEGLQEAGEAELAQGVLDLSHEVGVGSKVPASSMR